MKMSNMLDLLLGAGDAVLERPTESFEVSRLSTILGEKFTVSAHALTQKELDEIPTGENRPILVILAAVNDPDFSSEALRKKYTPAGRKMTLTSVELVKTLLLPGEITNLYNAIMALTGFSYEAIQKIEKN